MLCRLCNKEVDEKFYKHLNSTHKMKKEEYLRLFPEQTEEYLSQVSNVWNKGKTKETDLVVAGISSKAKARCNLPEIKKQRSDFLKNRYKNGDILDAETRMRVAKSASDGWVYKVQSATLEERKLLLQSFSKAGNEAQNIRRCSLTPQDYERLYPFAKGKARYHNCDFCNKQFIAWFGGKPRPKKRFCDQNCHHAYLVSHPNSTLPQSRIYYSETMKLEFCLHSNLEVSMAKILDNIGVTWCTPPFYIPYEIEGVSKKYYPDFFVSNKHLIELKSSYVKKLQGETKTKAKIDAAEKYCQKMSYDFLYLEFDLGGSKAYNLLDHKVVLDLVGKLS